MNVANMVSAIEAAGVSFRLEGEKLRVYYPDEEHRVELAEEVAVLRNHRVEVGEYLKARSVLPPMPDGVRLVRWEPKTPPIALTAVEIVTEVPKFITITLLELKAALAGKRWLAGHRNIRELIDRLEECGVVVEVIQYEERGEDQ